MSEDPRRITRKAQVYWGLETEGKDKVVCFRPTEVLGLGTGVTTAEGWPKLRTDCLVGLAWAACSFRLVPKGFSPYEQTR